MTPVDTATPELLTVTWAGDLDHFDLLQHSLQQSALAGLRHTVVVHSEDHACFAERYPHLTLLTTAEVLPDPLEARRLEARVWQQRLGRHASKWMGSLARYGGPDWVRYLGWQMQQISKLAVTAARRAETVLVLDSDVVVTHRARVEDYSRRPGRAVCLQRYQPADQVRGKVYNWNREAHRLLSLPFDPRADADVYFDTPFPLHVPTLRQMQAWLEQHYQRPWWQSLLALPPRRWSEFASYRLFLRHHPPAAGVDWVDPTLTRYVYDTSDGERLSAQLQQLIDEPDCHYITLHSHSSGRLAGRSRLPHAAVMAILGAPRSALAEGARDEPPRGQGPSTA